ncbi:LysR family transcriptional regulator [Pseudoalteromonas obscura]|uniref:LysR family transcriptional regulator n=1 Tax=Pseudoalteromonas obscura TaxID=3048491 RepID=A0ABT7ENJ9_9GAMM|nr:LysR family transcriptional regulator [Pseudoalteromonas sp. P94(2023)]MDK2596625.1 LysR family transcriptional regulator [Pseudoalteromonas sp. P94(2023)]
MTELDKLDVKQMRLLLLLLEKQSISRVAESLNVSQQAVSLQLKSLRAIFNNQLFVRHGRGIAPTPKALSLGKMLEGVLNVLEGAVLTDDFDPEEVERTIVISSTDYAQQVVTTALFCHFRKIAPNIKLIIKDLEIETLTESLTKGTVDFAITIPDFLDSNIPYKRLYNESYQLVTSAKSTLSAHIKIQELNNHNHLIVSPARANLRGSSTEWFKKYQVERNIVASIPSFKIMSEYVHHSDVVAFIPKRMLPDPKLKEIQLPDYPPGFNVVLAWHQKTANDPFYKWVVEQITLICSKLD